MEESEVPDRHPYQHLQDRTMAEVTCKRQLSWLTRPR